jgi:puromycin-sensitive aminopeptidase
MSREVHVSETTMTRDESPLGGFAYRLPRTVTPSRYDLELRLDPAASTAAGRVDITIHVHEAVDRIELNGNGLTDVVASILSHGRAETGVKRVEADATTHRLTLFLSAELPVGRYTLRITYVAALGDTMHGLYRSRYQDDAGNDHVLIVSDFQPSNARRCFPCWDEPDFKASFAVTLVVPEGLTALTNTPEVSREAADPGFVRVRFAPSMVMSTYLLCVVVGPLALTPAEGSDGIPVRVASRPERAHLAGYANGIAVTALEWFRHYFGIPYPERKLDQAAIPDFAAGAMENTGLVTYREQLLLLDPQTAAHEERVVVAETIAHELAHQWFGDLVTMRWWNGAWLNEAFATFMAYLCIDALEPAWRVFDTFQAVRVQALEVDSLATTRPIEVPVESPDDATGMFDVLTYFKGGAVLRMIEQWLGPDVFRAGIHRYLTSHAYANTETHDLWDALETASGQPVRRIMDAWIFQAGYPSVVVRRSGDEIRLTTHRFAPSLPEDATVWPVPLIVRQVLPDREVLDRVLVEAEGLALPLAHPDALLVANVGGVGFVRTFYDDELRARLVSRATVELTPSERLALVDDTWAAVVAGAAPVSAFLDLATGFAEETSPEVWRTLVAGLNTCDRFLEGEPRERFRASVRSLVGPALERLGWVPRDGETDLELELRGVLIRAMGVLGNDRATQALARETEERSRAGGEVEPSVAAAAVDVTAFVGGPDEFDAFEAQMTAATTPQEQRRYRNALTMFRDPALLERTLALATSEAIRPQDAPFVLARLMYNRDLGHLAWPFVRDHWDELVARFAPSNVIYLASGALSLTTPEDVADVQAFFAVHVIPQNQLTLTQGLERQRLMAALRQWAAPDLEARFAAG